MKKLIIRTILALLTFLIGLFFTAFWLLNRKMPEVPVPAAQKLRNADFIDQTHISKQQKKFWEDVLLPRFNEFPLTKYADSADEIYRLVLIPTFDAPVVVRISHTKDGYLLTTKRTDGEGGFGMKKFGALSSVQTRRVSADEWSDFIKLLDEAMFWDSPYIDKTEEPVEDGASWILEGFYDRNFHTVDRSVPDKDLQKACVYLLELSGLDAEYKGYYGFSG